jgi:hypothetical protein
MPICDLTYFTSPAHLFPTRSRQSFPLIDQPLSSFPFLYPRGFVIEATLYAISMHDGTPILWSVLYVQSREFTI